MEVLKHSFICREFAGQVLLFYQELADEDFTCFYDPGMEEIVADVTIYGTIQTLPNLAIF